MCIKLANEYNREFKAGHQSHLVDETPHFLITKKRYIYTCVYIYTKKITVTELWKPEHINSYLLHYYV